MTTGFRQRFYCTAITVVCSENMSFVQYRIERLQRENYL